MHLTSSVLALSAILAPIYAGKITIIPPDDTNLEFVGVEYKTAAEKLPVLYNYPNTANITNWEEMHRLLDNHTIQAGARTNIFRVPFNFNQLFIENSSRPVNETELNNLASVVETIVQGPGPSPYVAIVPEVVNGTKRLKDPDELYQFWRVIGKKFQHSTHVIFDLGLPATANRALAADLSQEAIRAIRRAGARKQYIFLPTDMATLNDPLRLIIRDPSHRTIFEVDINLVCGATYRRYKGPHRRVKKKKWPHKALLFPLVKWAEKTKQRTVVRRVQTNRSCPDQVDKLLNYMAKRPDRWAGWLWKENKMDRPDME
ncbi:unnamed protein product [Clonostachys solani]|uniref:cellulase n=1 Tax=Clonostachys solani TaxID=160281 RepID=A0A9N9W8C7_9HYPO|nr:unnamed protein product [Clonostachys solani]